MSVLQYPDAMNGPDLQIWTNAAFDNEESETTATTIKASWSTLQSDLVNQSSESLVSDCSKENLSLSPMKTPSFSVKSSSVPVKPLQPNTTILNSKAKPLKLLFKEGLLGGFEVEEGEEQEKERDEKKIDSEIEEIESEITRLSSRLEALRLEKAEKTKKTIEKRGRIVPAKFLEPKQSSVVKIEEALPPPPPSSSTKPKLINRRGLSLGPSEILAGAGLRRLSKIETTPVQATQSRRKSCFWKLQDIDELRVTKERGKSQSLSPKSRKTMSKTQAPPKQAVTTVSSKRGVKKEEAFLSSIQPKKLFKEGGEKSVTAKKPIKMGRVVASRYNSGSHDGRKRSLPENGEDDKDEEKRNDKRRVSFGGKQLRGGGGVGRELCRSQGTKKKLEVPSEVVVFHGLEEEEEKEPALWRGDALPRIKTLRCVKESPRDSGPAKRVAELIGRRSYFCSDEEVEGSSSVCQVLSFEEDSVREIKI